MYDHREEAIGALTPKSAEMDAATSSDPLPSSLNHLTVSRSSFVTHVKFQGTMEFPREAAAELRDDLSQLADVLKIDSRVLLDFADVKSFSPACIDALVVFNRRLKNRGSRTVLCSLAPNVRASFYG